MHVAKSSKVTKDTVERMAKLWGIEETVRGQSPDTRVAARQEWSAAIVGDLFALWQATLPCVLGKSKLAEALRYAISRRDIFERFPTDGRVEIDSNIVERAIRPQATTRIGNAPIRAERFSQYRKLRLSGPSLGTRQDLNFGHSYLVTLQMNHL